MNIPKPKAGKKRIVIVGGGFAGMALSNKLDSNLFQLVLLDKNNYHLFQPLLYQVATTGLEPSSISFPYRNLFHKRKDFYFRLTEVKEVDSENNMIYTSIGQLNYDYLVIATGTKTNFHGKDELEKKVYPMKSVEQALIIENAILLNLEEALITNDTQIKTSLLNIVIVGGGPTGIEIAGAISEMKRFVIPKDYPDLNLNKINIYLIQSSDRLLGSMSEKASKRSKEFLEKMGVQVLLNKKVSDYVEDNVILESGEKIPSKMLIWVSGVKANKLKGFPKDFFGKGDRILVNEYNQIKNSDNIFVIGDVCFQKEKDFENGHPQVAQAGIQQGKHLAKNLKAICTNKPIKPFKYNNKGTLATIGRHKAVADIGKIKISGFAAWTIWLLIHLRSILGVRNKVKVLINWTWNYFNYSQSMRFIFFPSKRKNDESG